MTTNILNAKKRHKINISKIKVKSSIIFIGVFVALILTRDVFSIPISSNFFIIISALIFLFYDVSTMLAFLAFLIPFTTGIPGSYITMFALVIYLIKIRHISISLGFYSVWIIALLELMNMLGTTNNFSLYMRTIIFLFLIAIMLTNKREKYDNYKIVSYYIYGYFWATMDIVLQTLREFSVAQFINSGIRFGRTLNYVETSIEGKLVSPNVNSLGIYSIMVIAFALVLISTNKNNYKFIPFLGLAVFIGILTYSRTFIVTLIVTFFIYLIFLLKNKKNVGNTLLIVTSIFGAVAIFAANNLQYAIQYMTRRFQVEDISSGRIDIALYYTNYLLSHPKALLVGVGLQDYKTKVNYFMSAHNGTQEVLIAWGLVGLLCVVLLFYSIYKTALRDIPRKTKYPLALVPSIAFLISLQASRLFSAGFLLIMLIPCYCIIRLAINEIE